MPIWVCLFFMGLHPMVSFEFPSKTLAVPSPFFPGILLFRKPPDTLPGKTDPVFEKNDG